MNIAALKEAWVNYKNYLREKYPTVEGEWDFNCEYHKRIDEIINPGYIRRMEKEQSQLQDRIIRLAESIRTPKFEGLPELEKDLLIV